MISPIIGAKIINYRKSWAICMTKFALIQQFYLAALFNSQQLESTAFLFPLTTYIHILHFFTNTNITLDKKRKSSQEIHIVNHQ